MRQNLLLLQDVMDLGRRGEIVSVKPGYARNFLLPNKKGVVASEHTLRMQARLVEERAKQAVVDKKESEALAKVIELITLEAHAKVDPEGKMYGSVSQQDILHLLEKHDIKLDKKDVILKHPLKEIGNYTINFRLKEGVLATCKLNIVPEGGSKIVEKKKESLKKEKKTEVIETEQAASQEINIKKSTFEKNKTE